MKTKMISILLALSLLLMSCGNDKKFKIETDSGNTNTYTFHQYGLFDKNEVKNEKIQYKVIFGNIVWAVLLSETLIAPIIIVGWYLYEPVGVKPENIKTLPRGAVKDFEN